MDHQDWGRNIRPNNTGRFLTADLGCNRPGPGLYEHFNTDTLDLNTFQQNDNGRVA